MAEVIIRNISKVYPAHTKNAGLVKTIDDISFTVHDKEFLVIVGPSGCGKSTLLRMIAGLEEITEGDLLIDGKRINDADPRDRDIAMVFQNYALYPHMTVYDNMAFGLKLKKFGKVEIKERVMDAARLLELEELLFRKPKTLSGGQRQRVAIGRAIIRRPKVFLFDEPLSNLDAKLRSQMRIELQKLHREINGTMIYVTHDQTEAMTLGNRIAVLNKGKLMQLDTPLHLYNNPDNKFVAGFIGSPTMNFIQGSLEKNEKFHFVNKMANLQIDLGSEISADLEKYVGKQLIAGIRPEHLVMSENYSDKNPDVLLEVVAYENMGNEQLLYFELDGKKIISRGDTREDIEIGKIIPIKFQRQHLYFIDQNTGMIIQNMVLSNDIYKMQN